MEIIKSSLSAAEPSLKDRVVNPGATFGPSNIKQLSQEISRDPVKFSELQEAVAELSAKQAEQSPEERSPSETVKLGVCEYLVGDYDAAVQTLAEKNDGDALNPFYRAKIALRLGRNEDAIACFNKAEKAGYPKGDCALGRAEAYRALGKSIESVNELDSISGETEQTVEYFYQRGATTADLITNPDDGYTKTPEEMINWYERAYETDRNNPGALFGMALENERRGNDDEALALYQRLVCLNPTYVGALINLGLLYEDRENYEEAVNCYKRVLDTDPTNVKAQMYIKDAEASLNRGRSTGRQRYTSVRIPKKNFSPPRTSAIRASTRSNGFWTTPVSASEPDLSTMRRISVSTPTPPKRAPIPSWATRFSASRSTNSILRSAPKSASAVKISAPSASWSAPPPKI